MDEGSGRGSSVSSSIDDGGGLGDAGDAGVGNMVGVGHHSRGNRLLDDRLALDWDGDRGIVRGINMDGDRNLDDVILVEWGIIGDGNLALNKDGSLDIVDLNLLVDDGSIDSLCSLEDGWDLDGEMGGGGLEDPGGVAGDEAGLAKVHLLGHHGGGLVDGGHTLGLGGGGEGSRGGGRHIVDGVGHHSTGGVVVGTSGGRSHGVGGGH